MKISIVISNLRIRKGHTTKSESLGFANPGEYEVIETYNGNDYKWYRITEGWVAGVAGAIIENASIAPAEKDTSKNQVFIGIRGLRIRSKPSTTGDVVGFCEENKYYDVSDIKTDNYYFWYKIGENAWCAGVTGVNYYEANAWEAPKPVESNVSKDQVYIGDVSLNIRKFHSTDSQKMGVCERRATYDVWNLAIDGEYTWYQIGKDAWIAGVGEVIFYQKGDSRVGPELKAELKGLQSAVSTAIQAVENNESNQFYDDLLKKVKDINHFINSNFDPFDYDLVDEKEYDEIDLLYTTDVHGAWVGYDLDGNYLTPIFSYSDVGNYRSALEKKNIKTLLVDCGDWSRPCRAYNDYLNTGIMYPVKEMQKQNYFAATYGNHEWRWSQYGEADTKSILDKLGCMTACNLFKNGKLVYKPYRTAKIGSKRIAVIGIGYPSANGTGSYSDGVWTFDDYTFYDDEKLFNLVQKHINTLKSYNFDYIVAICHMCKSSYESDSRYKARTDSLIENTQGLTAVLQGHYNFATNAEVIKDKGGNNVLLAHEAGANLNSFGRLRLNDKNITSYLLDERSDLTKY